MARPSRRRRALAWVLPLTLVPGAAAVSVALTTPEDVPATTREVFPLDQGTTWVYDVLDHGEPSGTRTSQIVGLATLLLDDGVAETAKLSRDYTDYPGTGVRSSVSWFGVEGDELKQYATLENGSFDRLTPAATSYGLDLTEGQELAYDGQLGDIPFAYEGELVAFEDVEVGGRVFEGCAHWVNDIRYRLDEEEPEVQESLEEWTCPGYGVVRSVDTIEAQDVEITEELTEFHGRAGSWYAEGHEPAPVTPAEPGPGSTTGFDGYRTLAVPDGELVPELAWTDARAEAASTAPVASGEDLVIAERSGAVSLRTRTGAVRWQVQVAAPAVRSPVVAQDRVVVGDAARRVWALSIADGRALWVRELDDILSAPPTLTEAGVAVQTEDGTLTMLDLTDGGTEWDLDLGGPARTPAVVTGGALVVADTSDTVTSVALDDGEPRWARSLSAAFVQGPVVVDADGDDLVVVSDGDGVIHAYEEDGDERWAATDRRAAEVPMTTAHGLLVTMGDDSRVVAHDTRTGERRWTRTLPTTVAPLAVVGEQVVATPRAGELLLLDLATGRTELRQELPMPVADSRPRMGLEPALVGNDLVVTASVSGDRSGTVMYAFPVDGRDDTDGVLVEHRPVPLERPLLNEPATRTESGDLLAPVGTELIRVSPAGEESVLASTETAVMTRAVVEGDRAYVRVDEEVQAVDLAGAGRLWGAPSGPPLFGSPPAVGADAVFFAEPGAGLAAVEKETGAERWRVPLPDAPLVGVPLALRDGDVLYGGDSVARYAGADGRRVWQVPDAYPFGPLAVAGDLVVAQTIGRESPTGVGAYDVRTGEQRWFAEQPAIPSDIGPVVADGVVVAADQVGTVTAYDATSGAVLWTLTLGHPLAGTPTVVDGRVVLTEQGTGMELEDRDHRVVVLDLQTGAFRGAWEPGSQPTANGIPVVSGAEGGQVLVPSVSGVDVVELTR